jgi:uncharacterized membrane protein
MIDVIFAIKFVHVLAAAILLGTWCGLALFMLRANRTGNGSVIALMSQSVVAVEFAVIAPALVLQPVSGFPLAAAIGLSPLNEFWIDVSLVCYAAIAVAWLLALRTEIRIRDITRDAAIKGAPLPRAYRGLFRRWCVLAAAVILGLTTTFAMMIWQPRLD